MNTMLPFGGDYYRGGEYYIGDRDEYYKQYSPRSYYLSNPSRKQKQRNKNKRVVVDSNPDLEEGISLSFEVDIYGVDKILDEFITEPPGEEPYYIYASIDDGETIEVDYHTEKHQSITIPVTAWIGVFRFLKIEIVQVQKQGTEVGGVSSSTGSTVVGRALIELNSTVRRYEPAVVRMVEGECQRTGSIVVLVHQKKKKRRVARSYFINRYCYKDEEDDEDDMQEDNMEIAWI